MSFQKWLRIVIPEIQLIDFIQKEGFRGKKQRKILEKQAVAGVNSIPSGSNMPSTNHGGIPQSGGAIKEAAKDARLGIKNLSLNRSNDELDQLFNEIKFTLNNHVLGQTRFIDDLLVCFKKAFLARNKGTVQNTMLIGGPSGTGKNLSLNILINELYKKKLTPYKSFSTLDLSQYSQKDIHTNFIVDCSALFSYGIGTVFFTGFEKAHSEVLHYVTKLFRDGYFRTPEGIVVSATDYFLILYMDAEVNQMEAGHQIPVSIANQVPPGLLREIQSFAYTAPLEVDSLRTILHSQLHKAAAKLQSQAQLNIQFDPNVFFELAEIILGTKRYGEAVQELVEDHFFSVLLDQRARGVISSNSVISVKMDDNRFIADTGKERILLKTISIIKEETLDDILNELNSLVGLESVKSFVHQLMQTVKLQKQREALGGKITPMTLHMVFTGNPGTGKTSVARLISRILKAMGLLSQGQLVEVARQDLVGEYVGSTAPKTEGKIQSALGGVLFVDEAYTLARNKHDSFGLEAIDTLVKGMEDHRDHLVVILAGYTNEMETFLKSNPGLRSRFPFIVEFPDYTPKEMLDIMLINAKQREYVIDPAIHEGLIDLFATKQIPGRNDSGNGRLVRNLIEEAIRKQSVRIINSTDKENKAAINVLTSKDFGIGVKEEFDLAAAFKDIIGLENVKAFIRTLEKQILANKRRKDAGIKTSNEQTLNIIFSGNPGTGKTTIARLFASMLKSMGILKRGHLVEVDRSHLVAEYAGQTAVKTTEVVESALGGVLFIDEAYSLVEEGTVGGGFGKEAIDTLVRLIENHRENLVVILAGYTNEMETFLQSNPGLSSRFPLNITFPDYTAEQLAQMTEIIAKSKGFVVSDEVTTALVQFYEKKQIPGKNDSGNGRLVRNTVESAIRNQSIRIVEQPDLVVEELNRLSLPDFKVAAVEKKEAALKELEQVIGLEKIKEFVRSLSAQIEIAKKREELGLPKAGSQSLHMVFKGNPGTGKTMIARILAKRLKELGVIKQDNLVETDRSGLVAGYVGQTALKTRKVLEKALGGVLFIDEAYALLGSNNDFGQEAIDTIVKFMDDHRENIIVILAGYDDDMEQFLDSNAGLRSRFPTIINFPDYTPHELLQISRLIFKAKGYSVSTETEAVLLKRFYQSKQMENAGNGRMARNLCELAIRNHALRVSRISNPTVEQLVTILPEDISEVGEQYE
ncbi:AAA+-type ATPase, SpoVK/Ycf46/Vps4 family [Bacillus sp. OV166]|uniref:AAA family ATPase n=1 Tax=Bacillus sp. OV166 TaxID=1882763 RepID=UPI000A2ADAFC|nr:AAA family ATPase [Bacillus sp. OV166]SMQ78410.1 AAA+-type ATPase, SpoVK/Ycf46/Vps4 family [Bacillus sp. OV166]